MKKPTAAKPATKTLTAAERTVSLFGAPAPETVVVEAVQEDAKKERVSMEEDADRNVAATFKYQQWVTEKFGQPAEDNQYRIVRDGDWFILQELRNKPGSKSAYGSTIITIHRTQFLKVAGVVVESARALKAQQEDGF